MTFTHPIFFGLLLSQFATAELSFKDTGKVYEVNCDSKPAVEVQINKANANLQ